jgi:hypothetical protein
LIWGNHLVTQSELYILKVEEFELIWGNHLVTQSELYILKVEEFWLVLRYHPMGNGICCRAFCLDGMTKLCENVVLG